MNIMNSLEPSLSGDESAVPYPYEIHFVDSEPSPATRFLIEENLARLAHFYDRITHARVQVRIPHKHGGVRMFHIHMQLDVPGRRLVVTREPEVDDKHAEIHIAIRDAFTKLLRQLEDFVAHRKNHKGLGVANKGLGVANGP